ncbi:MAG: thioredoxin domain-containing protein [Cyanobacteria bacterium J06626_23]
MASVTEKTAQSSLSKKAVGLLVAVAVAVAATFWLTQPAAVTSSFTPLSGLMTLKSTAAKVVPYEVAIANPQPTLIEFYADWCTTCQSMSPTIAALHQQYGDQVNFVMLDIDDPQWAGPIATYGASSVPQFTLLDGADHPIDTLVGKIPKPIFQDLFAQVLAPTPTP